MCNFKNKKDVLATVGDASGKVNHRIQSSNVSILSITYVHVVSEWTSGVDGFWKALWSARVLLIDPVIFILMLLLSLQEESIVANIDYDNKSELFLKLGAVERTACCHLDHPSDLLFHLTQTQVFIGVYSVKFEAILEHFVAEYFIALTRILTIYIQTMGKHKPNGLSGYFVFVVELDGLDPGGLNSLEGGIVASQESKSLGQ